MFNRWRTRLIISMRRRCSAWLPWEKFSRATFIPAMHICVIVSSFSQAGPDGAYDLRLAPFASPPDIFHCLYCTKPLLIFLGDAPPLHKLHALAIPGAACYTGRKTDARQEGTCHGRPSPLKLHSKRPAPAKPVICTTCRPARAQEALCLSPQLSPLRAHAPGALGRAIGAPGAGGGVCQRRIAALWARRLQGVGRLLRGGAMRGKGAGNRP